MKTMIVVTLIFFVEFPWCLQAQKEGENLIRNGDFEKFAGDAPDGWETSNIPGTLTVVSASKVAHSGQRALKCEVKDFGGAVVAGYSCQKNIQTGGKNLHLSGAFLVRSIEGDRGVIFLCFLNSSGSTVGTVEEYVDDTKSKFVDVAKDIAPPAGTSAVHVRLTVFPGKDSEKAHVGSYLISDDLKLMGMVSKEKTMLQ